MSGINDIARILSHPTWDIAVVFALIACGFFYGISAGKRRIAGGIVYTYVAFTIASAAASSAPFKTKLLSAETWFEAGLDSFLLRSGVFLGIFLLLAFTLGSRRSRGVAPASGWWQIFLLSFLQVGLLIHIILSFLPQDKIKLLAPVTQSIFVNPSLHIWWLVVPIAVLILMRRFEAREE